MDFYHFISKEKLEEMLSINREISLSSIIEEDIDLDIDLNNSTPKWKVGDVCYFDYNISYITDMWDDRIRVCSDGYGGSSSYDLSDRCFKITPHTIKCSNSVMFYYNWISQKEYLVPTDYIINFCDIHSLLIEMWLDILKKGDYTILSKFGKDVIESIQDKNFDLMHIGENVEDDFRIFRKRGSSLVNTNQPSLETNEHIL